MIRREAFAVVILLLASCAAPPRSPDSPYYVLPDGSTLVLEQAITIPSPGVSVWLQKGTVLRGTPDRYTPACKLEMRTRTESERTVEPDGFTVTKVERIHQSVAFDPLLRNVAFENGDGRDSPMAYEMRTVIYLESERQPDVFRLTCAHWDRPWFPEHLTLNQIVETLAGLFRIVPREE